MKKYLILSLCIPLFWSCFNQEIVPPSSEMKDELTTFLKYSYLTPGGLIRKQSVEADKITIIGTRGLRGDLQLLTYLVPVLADMNKMTMELWFLSGVDQTILDCFFSGDESEYTAKDLLFLSDPSRTGYTEYADYLDYLRDFISHYPEPLDWKISGITGYGAEEESSFIRYISQEIYLADNGTAKGNKILIHNPVWNSKGRMELPFQGALYYMMIHQWSLYQYSGIPLDDSPFGKLYLTQNDIAMDHQVQNDFDALILMGREEWLFPLNPIEQFINESNTPQALQSFPDQLIRKKAKPASYLMNFSLKREQKKIRKNLTKIQQILLENYPTGE